MLGLIILIVFGIGAAYFATQNTQMISITLAGYPLTGIPSYVVVLGSLLLGFVVSWIISLFGVVSSAFKIRGKDSSLKEANKQISDLDKRVHQLEEENDKLKSESGRV